VRSTKTKLQIQLLTKMLEIVLIPEILGPPKIGGSRLKPFQPNGKPRLSRPTLIFRGGHQYFHCIWWWLSVYASCFNLIAGLCRPVPHLVVKSYLSAIPETEIALELGKTHP